MGFSATEEAMRKGRRYRGSKRELRWQHLVLLFLTAVIGKAGGLDMARTGSALQGDCDVSSEALPSNGAPTELVKELWSRTASL